MRTSPSSSSAHVPLLHHLRHRALQIPEVGHALCMLRDVLRNLLSEGPTTIVPGSPLLCVKTFWPPITCSINISAAQPACWCVAAFIFCGIMPCSAWLDEQCQTCMATQADALLSLVAATVSLQQTSRPSSYDHSERCLPSMMTTLRLGGRAAHLSLLQLSGQRESLCTNTLGSRHLSGHLHMHLPCRWKTLHPMWAQLLKPRLLRMLPLKPLPRPTCKIASSADAASSAGCGTAQVTACMTAWLSRAVWV